VASHVGTSRQHNPKSNSAETVEAELRKESRLQGEPFVVEKPEFQNLVEGQGETWEPIPDYQIPVCGEAHETPILDQGSVAKPSAPETKEPVSPQQVPPDFGIPEGLLEVVGKHG
jgi:hypothetical protein